MQSDIKTDMTIGGLGILRPKDCKVVGLLTGAKGERRCECNWDIQLHIHIYIYMYIYIYYIC